MLTHSERKLLNEGGQGGKVGIDCTQRNISTVSKSHTVLHLNDNGGCVLIYIYKNAQNN